jgi:hypothetical protein
MEILMQDSCSVTLKVTPAELRALQPKGSLNDLLKIAEAPRSAELEESLSRMPEDVRRVFNDFDRDYLAAVRHFQEALVSMMSWALCARDQLTQMKSYLETEQMASEMGLRNQQQTVGG